MDRDELGVDSPDSDDEQSYVHGPRTTRRAKGSTPQKRKRARGELTAKEKQQPLEKKFQKKWLENEAFKGWLEEVKDDETKARCSACRATFNAGKSELEKHSNGLKHQKAEKALKNVRPIQAAFAGPSKNMVLEKNAKIAEIKLAAFFTEHNVAIQVADHLVQLIKNIFHDSEIAKKITLDRTKCTAIMKNVLAKTEKEEIVQDLKITKFSVLVDESTDVSNNKNMCLLVKYVSPETGLIRTPLLEMIELDSKDCSATALYGKFTECLTAHEVPITNCIGLACDHAPVMVGKNNSFYTRLKADCPWLVLMDCICHSSHIAASHACKKLPTSVKGTIKRIVSYVSGSPKRSAILEEFQEFYSELQRKILRTSATRWLVLHPCVVRLLENMSALEHFFLLSAQEDAKDRDAPALYDELRNPYFKAYLLFLKYTLNFFNRMNALFQHQKTLVHRLQSESNKLMKQMCQNYMREGVLDSVATIDVSHPHFQLPLEKIYLGPGVADVLATLPLSHDPQLSQEQRVAKREAEIKTFKLKCLDFYITAAQQLKMYLPLRDPIIREAAFIDPKIALSKQARVDSMPDLPNLCQNFKDGFGLDVGQVTLEWRSLPHEIPLERINEMSEMEPEDFWLKVSKMQNFNDTLMFPNLVKLARLVMSLPHSNADAEGVFAVVTDTKTKKRNRMGCDTLDSICVTRSAMRQKKIACYQYEVTDQHLKRHNKDMYSK